MTKKNVSLPVVEQRPQNLPAFTISTAFGCFSRQRLEQMPTDLLVLTAMSGLDLPNGIVAVDKVCDGRLTKALKRNHFSAALGEHRVVDLNGSDAPQKYVLVVGLGDYRRFNRKTACGLFKLVIDEAVRLGVKKVLLPIGPNRLSADSLGLRGTAAILRCRVEESALKGGLGNLEEIQIVCSPQAKKHIEEGLAVAGPRCSTCTDPALPGCPGADGCKSCSGCTGCPMKR